MLGTLMTFLLLCTADDAQVRLTVYFVRATKEANAGVDPALNDIAGELRQSKSFNKFVLGGSGSVLFTGGNQPKKSVQMQVATSDGEVFTVRANPGNMFNRSLELRKFTVQREIDEETTTVTGTGLLLKTKRIVFQVVLMTDLRAAEKKLLIAGTIAAPSAKGAAAYFVMVVVTSR